MANDNLSDRQLVNIKIQLKEKSKGVLVSFHLLCHLVISHPQLAFQFERAAVMEEICVLCHTLLYIQYMDIFSVLNVLRVDNLRYS